MVSEKFVAQGGISEFCEVIAPDPGICDPIRLHGEGNFTESVPVLDEVGHMVSKEVERQVEVDIALRWGSEYEDRKSTRLNSSH